MPIFQRDIRICSLNFHIIPKQPKTIQQKTCKRPLFAKPVPQKNPGKEAKIALKSG
jgi:hypothetical protein